MNKYLKYGLIGGTVVAGGLGVRYVLRLKGFLKRLQVTPTARIHKIDADGVEVAVDVKLDNPSSVGIKTAHPTVRLALGGNDIGGSRQEDKTYDILPRKALDMDSIRVKIQWGSLGVTLTKIPAMISSFLSERKLGIELEAKVLTTAWIPLPTGPLTVPVTEIYRHTF